MKHSLVGAVLLATSCNEYEKEKRRWKTHSKEEKSLNPAQGARAAFFSHSCFNDRYTPTQQRTQQQHKDNGRFLLFAFFAYLLFIVKIPHSAQRRGNRNQWERKEKNLWLRIPPKCHSSLFETTTLLFYLCVQILSCVHVQVREVTVLRHEFSAVA